MTAETVICSFVLVLISPHSWCVLPSGRPLIKAFSCWKLDYPSPLSSSASPAPSTPSAVPAGAKAFHFTCPSATLNIVPAFCCSDELNESYAHCEVFHTVG